MKTGSREVDRGRVDQVQRRHLITGLAGLLVAPRPASAQQAPAKIPRVGILTQASSNGTPTFDAFRQGLDGLAISRAATSSSRRPQRQAGPAAFETATARLPQAEEFLNAIKNRPHAEGARRARLEARTESMEPFIALILCSAIVGG